MAKKHRIRSRSRRSLEAARRASATRVTTTAVEGEPARAGGPRPRYGTRTGTARAIGAPSGALERAAASERSYVVRDFRRIAVVVVIALALLVASGLVLGVIERPA
ncbi:MAG: hypothetical protein E6I64_04495 [Chloroflexi bacterium]|nr:MAG: hypothetical protein E6I64_04495 [Chloroflexota bacterium]